jgi:hypothetical protein
MNPRLGITTDFTSELVDDSSTTDSISCLSSFYNSRRTEERPPPRTVRLLLRLFVATGTCLPNLCPAMVYWLLCKRVLISLQPCISELLSSNGRLFRLHYSGFRPSCHNIFGSRGGSILPSYCLKGITLVKYLHAD